MLRGIRSFLGLESARFVHVGRSRCLWWPALRSPKGSAVSPIPETSALRMVRPSCFPSSEANELFTATVQNLASFGAVRECLVAHNCDADDCLVCCVKNAVLYPQSGKAAGNLRVIIPPDVWSGTVRDAAGRALCGPSPKNLGDGRQHDPHEFLLRLLLVSDGLDGAVLFDLDQNITGGKLASQVNKIETMKACNHTIARPVEWIGDINLHMKCFGDGPSVV